MKNGYKIIWTEKAFIDLQNICNFILFNFSEKEVRNFLYRFNNKLEVLKHYPEMFPLTTVKPHLRKAVINKNSSIYYQFKHGKVHIVNILDNRRNNFITD